MEFLGKGFLGRRVPWGSSQPLLSRTKPLGPLRPGYPPVSTPLLPILHMLPPFPGHHRMEVLSCSWRERGWAHFVLGEHPRDLHGVGGDGNQCHYSTQKDWLLSLFFS